MKRWNLAITGFGAVGKAVAGLILARQERYQNVYHADVRLTAVCGSKGGLYDQDGLTAAHLSDSGGFVQGLTGEHFIKSAQADVLFEAGPSDFKTGGSGYLYMKLAFHQHMHVVAISKGALVFDYPGLRDLSKKQGVSLHLSGATAAALPTIDLLTYNLAGCEFTCIEGILTATTNVILSQMMEQGSSFHEALLDAQRLGVAESDPGFDVDGWDTACKITILANAALDAHLDIRDIERSGIGDVTIDKVNEWRDAKLVPKLIGCILKTGSEWSASVKLQLYPRDHIFGQVQGQNRAIRVVTDVMGEFIAIGGGSEPLATAAAALKDFEHLLSSGSTEQGGSS